MLAALRGEVEAAFGEQRRNGVIHGFGRLRRAALADIAAHYLAGRAAHYHKRALGQLRALQELRHRVVSLPGYGFI